MSKRCCKDCNRRIVGCHSFCKEYQAERQKSEELYAARAAAHDAQNDLACISRHRKRR